MPAPIVSFDIAGPIEAGQQDFYRAVFDREPGAQGRLSVPVVGPMLGGTLRADPAATLIYIGVPDVAATLDAIVAAGGAVVQPRFAVPGVVVLGLFTDPAGNVLGLVELDESGTARVP